MQNNNNNNNNKRNDDGLNTIYTPQQTSVSKYTIFCGKARAFVPFSFHLFVLSIHVAVVVDISVVVVVVVAIVVVLANPLCELTVLCNIRCQLQLLCLYSFNFERRLKI